LKGAVRRKGSNLSIITYGAMVYGRSMRPRNCKEGIDIEVLTSDRPPFDREAVETVKKTNKVILLHEDTHRWLFRANWRR
jgi:2-oxoisovalerate dehydrogenase E1 component